MLKMTESSCTKGILDYADMRGQQNGANNSKAYSHSNNTANFIAPSKPTSELAESGVDVCNDMPQKAAAAHLPFDRCADLRRFHSCSDIDIDSKRNNKPMTTTQQQHLSGKTPYPNYYIETDLEPTGSSTTGSGIIDSHTSYRKILDEEITNLKVQLAKAQTHADHLEHERNQITLDYKQIKGQMAVATDENASNSQKTAHLERVVSQLQEHVRESALELASMQTNHMEKDNKLGELQYSNKRYRNESRKLKKELSQALQDVEGKAMEIQGLKSENDWLKKQLWPEKVDDAESEEESDHPTSVAISGIRQFLSPRSPRKPRRRRRQSIGQYKVHDDIEQDNAQITNEDADDNVQIINEDAEDRTADYTSHTDFQLKSATESGADREGRRTASKQKIQQNSFIAKLAIRHGVTRIDGYGSKPQSRRGQNDDSLLTSSNKEKRAARRSRSVRSIDDVSSNKNSRRVSERQHMAASLSNIYIKEQVDPKKEKIETGSSGNQWNIWGIFAGNESKPIDPIEDETKDLSDSSHMSDECLHSNPQTHVHMKKSEHQVKPGTVHVLVPKRWSNNGSTK